MNAWDLQKHLADMEARITERIVQVQSSVQSFGKDLTEHKVEDAERIGKVEDRTKWIGRGVLTAFAALASALAAHIFGSKP